MTNYYPLTNKSYFEKLYGAPSAGYKKVVVLPFNMDIGYPYSMVNTAEKAEEKRKVANEFLIDAFRTTLKNKRLEIIDYVPFEAYDDNNFPDQEMLSITSEIIQEFNSAFGSIQQNLTKEKGDGFDYSVGLRVQELAEHFDPKPDFFLIPAANSYVVNLTILENNAANTAEAILSLGMSKLFVGSEDITFVQGALIDAQTGEIVWLNYNSQYGKTILLKNHIQFVVDKLFEDFSLTRIKSEEEAS